MADSDIVLRTNSLCKSYGSLQVLKSIDLSVKRGEFFGLLGVNGSGKTTFINIMTGICRAESGTMEVLGYDVNKDSQEIRRRLGVVPQELVYDPFFSVKETMEFQARYHGLNPHGPWIEELIERLHLTDKLNTITRNLSGGMKRRLMVAMALVHRPLMVVLDEPTAGVDINMRIILWDYIRSLSKLGISVLLTTHYLEEAEMLCDRVGFIKQGTMVACDKPSNLISFHQDSACRFSLHVDVSLPEMEGICIVEAQSTLYTLRADTYRHFADYLQQLDNQGIKFTDLKILATDLEDVFISITSGK